MYLSRTNETVKNILVDNGIINFLILLFVLDAVHYLINIKKKLEDKDRVKFHSIQSDTSIDINNYIKENKPQNADLLEYSSATITDTIDNLKKINCNIRLLIAHPNIATSELQKRRILNRIENLVGIDFKGYKNVQIKCYEKYSYSDVEYYAFASIRGRKFDDNFICFGWYTPTDKLEGGICGHSNPMICAYTESEPGKILKKHFDETFELLWKYGVPIQDVFNEYIKKKIITANPAGSNSNPAPK